MILNLSRIPEDVRVALHENPESISKMLYPEFDAEPIKKSGLFSRLFGKKPESLPLNQESLHTISESDSIDIDKTWHALHFLLTGSDWEGDFPRGFLVSCGEAVGDVDVGYGPARSFAPTQVNEIATYLSELDRTELRHRLDPEKMQNLKIYPSVWKDCKNIDEEWSYLQWGLDEVTKFAVESSKENSALLIYIN